jgi:cysteine desulfurase
MKRIYMDNAATTQVDPRVIEAMLPYFGERYGNAASRTHSYGWEAEEAAEQARARVASLIGADPKEIYVTSGATESDNLALKGVFEAYREKGRHLVTTSVEHPAVLDSARHLERLGAEVIVLPVDSEGRIDPRRAAEALRDDTVLVSVIHGNNETGVIQDVEAVGAICKKRGILFHVDATQSVGKVPVDVSAIGCDLLSLSAHKIHGPKGVGALYARRRNPRVRLAAQLDGGGHEKGVRSGTLNVAGLVGLGRACEIAREALEEETGRVAALRDRLEEGLLSRLDGIERNTPAAGRLPGILNLGFRGLEAEALLLGLRRVAISSGSACASASLEPSPVLLAMGRSAERARGAIRFSLGRFNTIQEVDEVIQEVCETVGQLRRIRSARGVPSETGSLGES